MRQCNCSGNCSPQPQPDGLSRRDFLELVGAGTAGALLATPAFGAFELSPEEFARWRKELTQPSSPRVYRSDVHTDARLHLGGIGTGNFEIGADGQLTTWQLFNTLRDGHVPFCFAAKAGGVTKMLQTRGGPDGPRVRQIEMRGEYPFAQLRFLEAEFPVQIELTAFTPFAPLDTALSSMPLAVFVFKIHNPTQQPQTVSLAALMTNPVGYDASGRIEGIRHPNFGANFTRPLREGRAGGLFMGAQSGQEPTLDKPLTLYTAPNLRGLRAPPPDRPENLKVEIVDRVPAASALADAPSTIVWLEEAPAELTEAHLRAARDAVQAGATLVFSGRAQPLLRSYAAASGGQLLTRASQRPDILFDDFENGYGKWTLEGEAFGKEPARGTLANQQRVSGFTGRALVNTFLQGDDPTGKATSTAFQVERHFIRFLIGGGSHARTQLRLVIGGKAVRSASGKDNERLEPAAWDVREFAGQSAHLEIVDQQPGPWGHVNVDQIVFSDEPANRAVLEVLEELLPARFAALRAAAPSDPADPQRIEFNQLELRDGATERVLEGQRRVFVRPFGKGQVALACGPILDPAHAESPAARQRAYAMLSGLVGARYVGSRGQHPKAPGFGTLALAALADEVSSGSFVEWAEAWRNFSSSGSFRTPNVAGGQPETVSPPGETRHGAIATTLNVAAGATAEVPFLLTWHYPNKYNAAGTWMGSHYSTRWPDARAVMRDAAANLATLRSRTEDFRRAFYDSTLPWWLLDCVTANAAIARHIGVVFRIANGDLYGWEGSNGCCQPTCTHVWGYEQTLARLFPDLEREMRRIDFKHQQRADGGVNNRTDVPSPPRPTGERPFADGHASCVLKAYREALNAPDESLFREYWPHLQRAVDYLIHRDAASHGGQAIGVLEDDQWNTYDQILHGVTTFISGYYLAALRAGEEWARRIGDEAAAKRFHTVFESGQAKLVELCWNGEYFEQRLADYMKKPGTVGPGCMSDQLIGQWWAHQLGLGYLLPRDKVVAALKSVFKYNFKSDLTGWRHAPRAFAGARDKGLIIVTWPKGGRPPHVMLYSDEVWTGIEYQVAAHLIYEGLIEEGLAVVKAARDRYDGVPRAPMPRNPWNEIECGGHYARAMSSWSLLLALSGWECDGPRQTVRIAPRYRPEDFRGFFTGAEGWGIVSQRLEPGQQRVEIAVRGGALRVRTISLALAAGPRPAAARVTVNGQRVEAQLTIEERGPVVTLASAVRLSAPTSVVVDIGTRL